jgi:hypothetical protein
VFFLYSFFFFGGLSMHLIVAILAHLFSYNITWESTKKEVERSNFFIEVPRIWKRFGPYLVLSVMLLAGIAVLATPLIPAGWRIDMSAWAVMVPLMYVVCS